MKKLISLLTASLIIFSLFSCADSDGKPFGGADKTKHFEATVLEVGENYLLVEPLPEYSESKSADKISVSLTNLSEKPDSEVGDRVEIYYSGEILESYPARVSKAYKLKQSH